MDIDNNQKFGGLIGQLINKTDLSEAQSYEAFCMVLNNEVTEMQQGAFLAALTSKGESAPEVAGGWRAIYDLDTTKTHLRCADEVVDNCGTGMDSFKTFNISTAASIIAAAGGVKVARHGARAISSTCGTVDIAESLGVDVECSVDIVANSIETTGLGLFNGMSPQVHPLALGRILSQIRFGSPLNIAASLANPALPRYGVRGVYSRELLMPVARVMDSIGYLDAMVMYGSIEGSDKGMDEASVCGTTYGVRLHGGTLTEFSFTPEDCGLIQHQPEELAPETDRQEAAKQMLALLAGQINGAKRDAILLNSACIFHLRGLCTTMKEGVKMADAILTSGKALQLLHEWVRAQSSDREASLSRLEKLKSEVLN
ncbi:anthranilate phosphoribosyltransferase [Desulfosediminicola ganghwensis]|uniref:anthranilate phosphoribosyltransferase n=1 Tax=Desulfosediminicola ganghwensis TaxID=2569540 RepID=UPI0010AC6A47|nr:anthranilate phosphoribosyltransferase [Desulfosediminicola ganghwensis]